MSSPSRIATFSAASLVYTFGVILFGAVVRITGSGAGCGQHWPTCHGDIVHLPQSVETAIELTHRLTSGICLPLVLILCILVWRRFPRGHACRSAALASVILMITEAMLGAGLVLLELVGMNNSAPRAAVMAGHLVNTSLLTAAMTATTWFASGKAAPLLRGRPALSLLAVLAALLVVNATGAITALGDTLYPAAPQAGTFSQIASDQSGTAHFLERMRILHPVVAVGVALLAGWTLLQRSSEREAAPLVQRTAAVSLGLLAAQVVAGFINVALSAPAWMQVAHLALATALWISIVAFALARLEASPAAAAGVRSAS